jgi:tetratricopeptide (TPR) repeat protein
MDRRISQESPVELIDGGQFLTAEEMFSERRTNDPLEMVVRAEVAIYFGRLDDGAALLEEVGPRVADIDVAARYSLARGRLALWRCEDDQADTQINTAYHFYLFLSDSFGFSQSLLGLARLARRRGELDEAVAKLDQAQESIKSRNSKKAEFLRGQITAEQAALAADRGEIDRSTELFSESARLLKATERGRYYARSIMGMADLKCALGEFQDSLDLYKEANTVFERYFIKQDLSESNLKLATALVRLNRFERAEKLAEESQQLCRGAAACESAALAALARIALQQGKAEEAAKHAVLAVELADKSSSTEARTQALIALGQVRLSEHEFKQATECLKEATDLSRNARGMGDGKRLELEAAIYLAEAYHSVDTRAGRAELTRAAEILNVLEDAWLGDEFNRVSAKYEEQIIFTEDNRLVFDGNQLPRWQEAKRTLEGFLLRNALRQTSNSLTRAARKLGVSKVHVHNLKKKHNL